MNTSISTSAHAQYPAVEWRDLIGLSPFEKAIEYARPLALLILELLAWHHDLPLLGGVVAFFFFLAALRLVHDTFHGNLGVGRAADRLCLTLLSVAMLGSMHAVQRTHLLHHRFCLGSHDIEAAHVERGGWHALAYGPIFPLRLHRAAWRSGTRHDRARIVFELALSAAMVACTSSAFAGSAFRMHVAAMIVANWLTAFFALWTVHRGCPSPGPARTLRNRLKSTLAMDMFYHEEHHRFPRVPTARLAHLALRLDRAEPGAQRRMVY